MADIDRTRLTHAELKREKTHKNKHMYNKLLITGKNGMLARAFALVLKEKNINFVACDKHACDVTKKESVQRCMAKHKPDIIIHCAAYTAVDKAETDRLTCFDVNVTGTENLLATSIPLIHFSTDYVFDGTSPNPLPENHDRHPLNAYGASKVASEKLLKTQKHTPWWNIRTSWLYDDFSGFPHTILQKAQNNENLRIINDQFGRPTHVQDVAYWVTQHFIIDSQDTGHYHGTASGPGASWADIAEYTLNTINKPTPVETCTSKNLDLPAIRPQNSILQNTKLPQLPDWKESLHTMLTRVYT